MKAEVSAKVCRAFRSRFWVVKEMGEAKTTDVPVPFRFLG